MKPYTKRDMALVLRTVYLDSRIDEELRKLAYADNMSVGELIRKILASEVEKRRKGEA